MINKKLLLGILLVLSLVVVSGCVQPPPSTPSDEGEIKSQEDVKEAAKNMTSDVEDIGNILSDLEQTFE